VRGDSAPEPPRGGALAVGLVVMQSNSISISIMLYYHRELNTYHFVEAILSLTSLGRLAIAEQKNNFVLTSEPNYVGTM
jgi:hypothetical protein